MAVKGHPRSLILVSIESAYATIGGVWCEGLGAMASGEQSPQRGPGAEPLVRVMGAKPPEAKSVLAVGHPTKQQNLHVLDG